jgi:precorrin isomerase
MGAEQSKATVAEIVSKYPLSKHERRVAGRVVVANADPSFMDLIVFKYSPIEKGIQCIQDG